MLRDYVAWFILLFLISIPLMTAAWKDGTKAFGVCYRVSQGTRDLPGSFQSATSNVSSGKSLLYLSLLLTTGGFFVFIAFTTFLPVMVLVPQKFAICFTIGCAMIIASLFAVEGPKNQLAHMTSKEI